MTPPTMAGWNLALRFGLELTAIAGFAAAGWKWVPGPTRWIAMIVIPIAVMILWVVFNVPGDPSRSGEAPVTVPGVTRLGLELTVLVGGAVALAWAANTPAGLVAVALVVVHYAASTPRIGWLLA